jgi:hypothetical protein
MSGSVEKLRPIRKIVTGGLFNPIQIKEAAQMPTKTTSKPQKADKNRAKRVPSVKRLAAVRTLHCSKSQDAFQ